MEVLWLVLLLGVATAAGQTEWDNVALTVPYRGERIAVFRPDQDRVPELFYFMPLVQFVPESPVCVFNHLTGLYELKFEILMWSQESLEFVHQYLKSHLNDSIQVHQVEPLPMEKIRLMWRRSFAKYYSLVDTWRANTDSSAAVQGRIICQDSAKCDYLKTLLREEPDSMYALEMEYVVSLQSRRDLTLTGRHLERTNLYASLSSMPVQSNVRYLTEEAADTLAAQTVAVALSSVLAHSVDAQDELRLTNELKNKLKNQQVSTKSFLPEMWPSVYWESGSSRPDKVAQFLNAILGPDASDATCFIVRAEEINANEEYKQCALSLGILMASGSNTFVNRIKKQAVIEAVKNKYSVGMKGDKFVVEDFLLYRFNLLALSSSASLVSSPVRSRSGAVHSAKVGVQTGNFTTGPVTVPGSQMTQELVQTQIDNRFQAVAKVFNAWPDYCRLYRYYCNSGYLSSRSSMTLTKCRESCDLNVRCQALNYCSSSRLCQLINSPCEYSRYKYSSRWEHDVKISRVPEITPHMWKTIFANGTLGDLATDPCRLLGNHGKIYSKVP